MEKQEEAPLAEESREQKLNKLNTDEIDELLDDEVSVIFSFFLSIFFCCFV
jgi:hypothetical protein